MSAAVDRVVRALEARGCKRGSGRDWQCPAHDDRNASLGVWAGHRGAVIVCQAGCRKEDILAAIGLRMADLFDEQRTSNGSGLGPVVETYDYVDERSELLYQVTRHAPKDFRQRRPDGQGGWLWKLGDARRVLYRLPAVLEAGAAGKAVFVVEGEKDVHAIEKAGGIATCNPAGAGKWRPEYSESLRGAEVVVVADKDTAGYEHAVQVARSLEGVAASVRVVEAAEGKDAADHLGAGKTLEELVPAALGAAAGSSEPGGAEPQTKAEAPALPRSLCEVLAIFQRWFHLPDTGALLAVLGAVAANRREGDPVWILLVAPPGWGKTEVVAPLSGLPDVHPTATLTEAALLSGTSRREAKGAKGGLLREIGDFGIILCKDFGSVLSMNRDARAQALGALREVFDGSWTRHVGTDGGKTLHWEGKVGLIAGCTAVIDSHHSVMGAMGDRMALYRLPEARPEAQLRKGLRNVGRESDMRRELREAVAGLLVEAQTREVAPLTEAEEDRLVALACLVVAARSSVIRDNYSRDIEHILGMEAPARLGKMLLQLFRGIVAIGASRQEAWEVIIKSGLDCIPAIRRKMLEDLATHEAPVSTSALAEDAGYPTNTARRALEELVVYGLATRIRGGEGKPDLWEIGDETRLRMRLLTVSKMSEGVGEGTVSKMSEGEMTSSLFKTPNHTPTNILETVSDAAREAPNEGEPAAAPEADWRELVPDGFTTS